MRERDISSDTWSRALRRSVANAESLSGSAGAVRPIAWCCYPEGRGSGWN